MSLPQWCGTPETHHAHDGCWGWPTPVAPAVPVGVPDEQAVSVAEVIEALQEFGADWPVTAARSTDDLPFDVVSLSSCDGRVTIHVVPVGVQPASEAATSATDRAVPTRPEPAEEGK